MSAMHEARTRQEYDQLDSNGQVNCPDCGKRSTTPYPGCHCPGSPTGYGTRHINEYHHQCDPFRLEVLASTRRREQI